MAARVAKLLVQNRFRFLVFNTTTIYSSPSSARCSAFQGMYYCTGKNTPKYDVTVVGGGIVGMATARELSVRHPNTKFAVIEKERNVAEHQSGHNSGVIHAGIYYTPGSLKAKLCVRGLKATYEYCDKNNVPYKKVGKLIVAVNKEEADRLKGLYQRGLENEVPGLQLIGPDKIREIEPNCQGLSAIYSPITGIIDYAEVTKSYARNFVDNGGAILYNFEVTGFHESTEDPEYPISISITTNKSDTRQVRTKYVIACGGLYADKIAQMSGCSTEPKIVPFRGEYLLLKPERSDLVRGNIYPVPSPKFPFLGVHFTPRMDGSILLGPNAVLAFKREGYTFTDINLKELAESVGYRGTRKLVLKNILPGAGELYRRFFRIAQVKILQQYVPSLKLSDVTKGPTGVRAQALNKDGALVDDFIFDSGSGLLGQRMLHVRNAPSPAATSSLAIAEMVADKAKENFKF